MASSGNLRKYVIVRDIPGVGSKTASELRGVSSASCKALKEVGTYRVQWVQSYVVDNRQAQGRSLPAGSCSLGKWTCL